MRAREHSAFCFIYHLVFATIRWRRKQRNCAGKTDVALGLSDLSFCGGVQSVNMYRNKGDLPSAEAASDAKEKPALIATAWKGASWDTVVREDSPILISQ